MAVDFHFNLTEKNCSDCQSEHEVNLKSFPSRRTFTELFFFFLTKCFKDNCILFIYLFILLTCQHQPDTRAHDANPPTLEVYHKKKKIVLQHFPQSCPDTVAPADFIRGFLETFPFHPLRLQSHQKSARGSLAPLQAILATHVHQEEDGCKRGSRWMCVMCVPFNLPDCWSSLGACSAAARWGWEPI